MSCGLYIFRDPWLLIRKRVSFCTRRRRKKNVRDHTIRLMNEDGSTWSQRIDLRQVSPVALPQWNTSAFFSPLDCNSCNKILPFSRFGKKMFKYNVERTAGYTKHILFVENKSADYLAKSNVFEGSTFLLGYIIIKNRYGNYIFRYSNKRRSSQWDIEKEMHDEDVERRDKNKTNQRLGRSFFFVPATIDFRLEVTKQTDWTNLKRNARHQSRVTSFLCIFFVLFFILIFWFDMKKKIGKRIERNYVVVLRHDALATAVFNRFVQTRLCEIRRIVYGI